METSLINQIWMHATASTSAPTVPAKYANVSAWSGAKSFGSKQNGADFNLAAGTVDVAGIQEDFGVRPARGKAFAGVIQLFRAIEMIEFDVLDASEALFTLDSQFSIASNIGTHDEEVTNRSLLIEVTGLYYDYYPSCKVTVAPPQAGYAEELGVCRVTCKPIATTSFVAGYKRYWYQAA